MGSSNIEHRVKDQPCYAQQAQRHEHTQGSSTHRGTRRTAGPARLGALGQDIGVLLLFCFWGVAGRAPAGAGSFSCRAASLADAGMGLLSGEYAATEVSLEGMAAPSSFTARTAALSVLGACMGGVRAEEDMAT